MASKFEESIKKDTCEKEHTNFMRVLSALCRVVAPLLRVILEKQTDASNLKRIEKRNQWLRNFLNQRHQRLYYCDFPNYDLSLLYAIFRSIELYDPPSQGWSKHPAKNEITFGDDLERIRLLKNELSHSRTLHMSENDFHLNFEMLYAITERIQRLINGNTTCNFVKMMDGIETQSLCYETNEELKKTLKMWREETTEVKNFIQDHCILQQHAIVSESALIEFKKMEPRFAYTSAIKHAKELLQTQNFIVVVGLPGDGKTWLGMFLMSIATGRIKLKVNLQNLITLSIQPGERYVIFMDDCFKTADEISNHGQNLGYLYPKIKDGTIKMIVTCLPSKLQLWKANKFIKQYLLSDCIITVSGNGHNFSSDDKAKILESQLEQQLSDRVVDEILQIPLPFGFPKCTELFAMDRAKDSDVFKEKVIEFCFQEIFTFYTFDANIFPVLFNVFTTGYVECDITIQQGKEALQLNRTIEELEADCILKLDGTKYSFLHQPLFEEAMARLLATKFPPIFIKHCRLHYLLWIVLDADSQRHNTITISSTFLPLCVKRIVDELKTRQKSIFEAISVLPILEHITTDHVASLKDMKDEENRTLLIHVTRAGKRNILENLINGIRSGDMHDSFTEIVIEACRIGNKDIFELIVHKMVKKLEEENIKETVFDEEILYQRCTANGDMKRQHAENVCSSVIKIRDNEGNNILMISAMSGNLDLLELICEKYPNLLVLENVQHQNIFHAAACSTNSDVVKFVLEKLTTSQLYAQDTEGNTAIHIAAGLENIPILELLAERFTDLFSQKHNNAGLSAMHICVIRCQVEVLRRLMGTAIINNKTEEGETIVHLAARYCKGANQVQQVIELFNDPEIIFVRDNAGKTALHAAAESGTRDVFQHLLNEGLQIDAVTNIGDSVYHRAASHGNMDVLPYLRSVCRDDQRIQWRNKNGLTPLHSSVESNSVYIFKVMIGQGFAIDDITHQNQTVLHLASEYGSINIVKFILQTEMFKYIVKQNDKDGKNALHSAAIGGHINVLELLEPSYSSLTKKQRTVFHIAVENDNHNLVDYLIRKCDNPENLRLKDNDGMTALHIASKHGLVRMFKKLKQRVFFAKPKLKHYTLKDETILMMAIAPGNAEMVRHLLTCDGIRDIIQQTNNRKFTALHLAAKCGDVDIFKALEKEISIKTVTSDGDTVLHLASQHGNLEMVQYIYRCKHSSELFTTRNKKYISPLHLALENGHEDVVVELLKEGMCLSDRASDCSGCIHFAARSSKLRMVEFVLEKDADAINRRDEKGHTALFYCIEADSIEIFDMLAKKCSFKHFIANRKGLYQTVLHYAARIGNISFVKHILENHPELRYARNSLGNSSMHIASEFGHIAVVKELISRGHVATNVNDKGKNLLDIAISNKKDEMIKYIKENVPL